MKTRNLITCFTVPSSPCNIVIEVNIWHLWYLFVLHEKKVRLIYGHSQDTRYFKVYIHWERGWIRWQAQKHIHIKLMITIEYNKSDKCNISVFRNKTGMLLVLYHISKQNSLDFNLAPLAVIIKIIICEFDPHPWSIVPRAILRSFRQLVAGVWLMYFIYLTRILYTSLLL